MQRGIITDYEQTYDQKGHPVNARSREYGKAKRAAHNDALAAIGAIKRKSQEQAAEARIHKQTEQSDIPWALRSPQTLASAFGGLFVQSVIMTVGQWPLQMMDRLFVR